MECTIGGTESNHVDFIRLLHPVQTGPLACFFLFVAATGADGHFMFMSFLARVNHVRKDHARCQEKKVQLVSDVACQALRKFGR